MQIEIDGKKFNSHPDTRLCHGCEFHKDPNNDRCEQAIHLGGDCYDKGIIWIEDGKDAVMSRQVGGDHYQKAEASNMQPWDIARAWKLNGWEMNVLKYLLRHKHKNKEQDLEKAIHYLQYLIQNYEELFDDVR